MVSILYVQLLFVQNVGLGTRTETVFQFHLSLEKPDSNNLRMETYFFGLEER